MTIIDPAEVGPSVEVAVRTLLTGGFVLEAVDRNPGYALLRLHRMDEFGAVSRYCFMLSEAAATEPQLSAARIAAGHDGAHLIVVADASILGPEPRVSWPQLLQLLGGPVLSTGPLDANFPSVLDELGHNRLPATMSGEPDDLFEAAVRESFQFVLGTRVIRYGQNRRFEARPDGIVLPRASFAALFDAKAYTSCYEVDADSVRRFSSYVAEFASRYRAYLPRVNSFIVISGTFCQNADALRRRSQEFVAECGVTLCFLTSVSLGRMIVQVRGFPAARGAVAWRLVFGDPIESELRLQEELERIRRDGLIEE